MDGVLSVDWMLAEAIGAAVGAVAVLALYLALTDLSQKRPGGWRACLSLSAALAAPIVWQAMWATSLSPLPLTVPVLLVLALACQIADHVCRTHRWPSTLLVIAVVGAYLPAYLGILYSLGND